MKFSKYLESLTIQTAYESILAILKKISLNLPKESYLKTLTFYNYMLDPKLTHVCLKKYLAQKIPQITFEYYLGPLTEKFLLHFTPIHIASENNDPKTYNILYERSLLLISNSLYSKLIQSIKGIKWYTSYHPTKPRNRGNPERDAGIN